MTLLVLGEWQLWTRLYSYSNLPMIGTSDPYSESGTISDAITGAETQFEIGGGSQPTLTTVAEK